VRLLTKPVALHGARLAAGALYSVHPAFIEGPMAEGMVAQSRDRPRREKLAGSVPLGRFARPPKSPRCASIALGESLSSPAPNSCSMAG
jgi:hypothetical protein